MLFYTIMWKNNIFFRIISRPCVTTASAQTGKQIPRFSLHVEKGIRDFSLDHTRMTVGRRRGQGGGVDRADPGFEDGRAQG